MKTKPSPPPLPALLPLLLLPLLAACRPTAARDPLTPRSGLGENGLVLQNAVECFGDSAFPLPADQLYLAPHGDDANPGDSPAAPLRTLAFALCNLRPGQTLNILPGTYHASVVMGAFGGPQGPITIRGLPDGDAIPILDGRSTLTMGLALVESTNIVVENLHFRNYTDEGLLVLLGADLIIRDNLFTHNGRASIDPEMYGEGFGLNVLGARRVLIQGNQAIANGPNQQRWQNFTLGTGINTFELQDATIIANQVHDNIGGGILVEDGLNILVADNHITANQLDANGDYWDGGIWVDGSRNVTLRGNQIIANNGPGINISDEDVQYPDSSYGLIIEGNLITDNLFGLYIWNYGVCPLPGESILLLIDNQIQDNTLADLHCLDWACGDSQPCD